MSPRTSGAEFSACRQGGVPEPELTFDAGGVWTTFLFDEAYLWAVAAPRMAQATAPVIPQFCNPVSDLVSDPVVQLLRALLGGPMPTSALLADLNPKHRHSFRTRYLRPAMEEGWIEPTLSDKLNSRLQRYRLTAAGRARA